MDKKTDQVWDVIVIGGGPAGMMAAGTAAEKGAEVLLIEKNETLGKKLLITGGGRCNVTNAESDIRKLLSKFKGSDKFLFSVFSQHTNIDTIEFFNKRGVPTKIENDQRVFPASNSAESIYNVLFNYLKEGKVNILPKSPATGFIKKGNSIESIKLKNGDELRARNFILSTGGKSHPETGSTGDGFKWLKTIGHTVIDSNTALVPIAIKESWIGRLAGITLKEAKITVIQNDKKQISNKGRILFTHVGLSGPTILNMSKGIGELLEYNDVLISLDVLPNFDHSELNKKLQEIFKEAANKKLKNSLPLIIPTSLSNIIIELSNINPDTPCHSITREERLLLIKILKDTRINVSHLLGVENAIITSGGVKLEEIDFKTMKSKIINNLYIIGDLLNIDRPSGGYSLELCWTTGFVAGKDSSK